MARMGSFAGGGNLYGEPLSIIHPPDNNVDAARYAPELLDKSLKLTEAQREELQKQVDELYGVLRGERDYFGN
jgi:hypothetical protein